MGTGMKCVPALSLLIVLVAVAQAQKPLPLEGIDVDSILQNTKLINKHIKCVRDEGRCDTDGKNLKTMIPRVLNENCAGCPLNKSKTPTKSSTGPRRTEPPTGPSSKLNTTFKFAFPLLTIGNVQSLPMILLFYHFIKNISLDH